MERGVGSMRVSSRIESAKRANIFCYSSIILKMKFLLIVYKMFIQNVRLQTL